MVTEAFHYYYDQMNRDGSAWVEIGRSFLTDSTWSEEDTEAIEALMYRLNAKEMVVHTLFHGYRFIREAD